MGVTVFRGKFGEKQAERLLWRAGFGPRPGEAKNLARKGLKRAVLSMTRVDPKKAKLNGPKPSVDGLPLAPNACSLPQHATFGVEATLRVRRR